MITDQQIQINMLQYMIALQEKYTQAQTKKKQIEELLNRAATKIQIKFRSFMLKKKMKCAFMIQRAWKQYKQRLKEKKQIIRRFREVYFGTKIAWFIQRSFGKNQQNTLKKKQTKADERNGQYLFRISVYLPNMIQIVSALMAQDRYINKYRIFLRQDFEKRWQIYEKKISKQMKAEMSKKWVKTLQNGKVCYLTETDKKINPDNFISNKLDAIYQETHSKLEKDDARLKENQNKIRNSIIYNKKLYEQCVLSALKNQ